MLITDLPTKKVVWRRPSVNTRRLLPLPLPLMPELRILCDIRLHGLWRHTYPIWNSYPRLWPRGSSMNDFCSIFFLLLAGWVRVYTSGSTTIRSHSPTQALLTAARTHHFLNWKIQSISRLLFGKLPKNRFGITKLSHVIYVFTGRLCKHNQLAPLYERLKCP